MNNLIRLGQKIARSSRNPNYNHSCIIVAGSGRIISTGYNHEHVHAERMAIARSRRKALVRQATLINHTLISLRFTRKGALGNSKPCSKCMELIRFAGVKVIVYAQDGYLKEEEL